MKGFVRKDCRFSLCGLNCILCSMHLGGYCPGCGGGAGNQSCTIARCSLEQGQVAFCWECSQYPCARYQDFDQQDSFVPHRNRKQDIALAQEMGMDAYLSLLEKKRAILNLLLEHYNAGRQKNLFTTAVYLLPLEDLEHIMNILNSQPEHEKKERASAAANLLQAAADRRGICLKLRKK